MKVARLPVDPGPAGWNCILPDSAAGEGLERAITADVLVIGAGFAGLAAARRLRQLRPDARIVVLEARRVAEGPAGRNSGFMIDLPHDLASDDYGGALDGDVAQTQDNRAAIAFAAEMAQDYSLSEEAFSRNGKVNAAATHKGIGHNRDFARHLTAMGEVYQMLDASDMAEITGISFYRSGLFTPGTAMIQPALFVRGVADGLRREGVEIYEDSPVLTLDHGADWVARTPDGQVNAAQVILAVNGHLNSFGFAQGRLMHVFTYASMTRDLSGDETRRLGGRPVWGVTPADPMGTTVRRISGIGGDRIVVRNRFTFDPEMEVSDARVAAVGRDHDRSFAARFGDLAGVEMAYRWGGRLCLSRNNVQMIGQLDDGLYSACCQNGLGTAKGTLAGMLAADLACGHRSNALDRALGADSPKPLPHPVIARLGAAAKLKWSELRAGKEL